MLGAQGRLAATATQSRDRKDVRIDLGGYLGTVFRTYHVGIFAFTSTCHFCMLLEGRDQDYVGSATPLLGIVSVCVRGLRMINVLLVSGG